MSKIEEARLKAEHEEREREEKEQREREERRIFEEQVMIIFNLTHKIFKTYLTTCVSLYNLMHARYKWLAIGREEVKSVY